MPSVLPWIPVPSWKNMSHVHVPPGADEALALAEAPGAHQDQRERDVGGRVREDAGGVRGTTRPARAHASTSMLS